MRDLGHGARNGYSNCEVFLGSRLWGRLGGLCRLPRIPCGRCRIFVMGFKRDYAVAPQDSSYEGGYLELTFTILMVGLSTFQSGASPLDHGWA